MLGMYNLFFEVNGTDVERFNIFFVYINYGNYKNRIKKNPGKMHKWLMPRNETVCVCTLAAPLKF